MGRKAEGERRKKAILFARHETRRRRSHWTTARIRPRHGRFGPRLGILMYDSKENPLCGSDHNLGRICCARELSAKARGAK